jgi:hypothetical protein
MPEETREPVRLEGARLERVRRDLTAAIDHALSLAEVVTRELHLEIRADDVTQVRIYPGNARAVFYNNGLCIGVIEDPPGVSRPCGPREGVQQA